MHDTPRLGRGNGVFTGTAMVIVLFFLVQLVGCAEDVTGIEVVKYKGEPITPEMNAGWTVEKVDERVILYLGPPNSDVIDDKLILLDVETDLPVYGGFTSYTDDELPPLSLRSGTIAIQSFDVGGEVSGVIRGDLSRGPGHSGPGINSAFWVSLAE